MTVRDRRMTTLQEYEREAVQMLGEEIGYGNMMYLAQRFWRESAARRGDPAGAEFAIGPCVALIVNCDCVKRHEDDDCVWCGESGWLTKRVKEAKDASGE